MGDAHWPCSFRSFAARRLCALRRALPISAHTAQQYTRPPGNSVVSEPHTGQERRGLGATAARPSLRRYIPRLLQRSEQNIRSRPLRPNGIGPPQMGHFFSVSLMPHPPQSPAHGRAHSRPRDAQGRARRGGCRSGCHQATNRESRAPSPFPVTRHLPTP